MITLDHLTRGRVAFGMGVGGGIPSDLTVFGLDHDKAGKRMNESIEAMMGLLESDGPFSMKTDWFELKHSILQMRPYTEPHFRFAVASTHDDNVRMMGRVGGLVLTGGFPERVPDIVNNLAAGAAETGIDAGRDQIRLSYVLHVAPTQEEAIEGFRDGAIREFYEFQVGVNGRPEPPEGPDAWFDGYCEQHLIGTPEHVASKLEQIVAESGGVGGFIFMNRDWAGLEANRESWRLFADQVVPHFV